MIGDLVKDFGGVGHDATLLGGEAHFRQDLIGVLADRRRVAADGGGGPGEAEAWLHGAVVALAFDVPGLEQGLAELGIVDDVLDPVGDHHRDRVLGADLHPVGGGARRRGLGHHGVVDGDLGARTLGAPEALAVVGALHATQGEKLGGLVAVGGVEHQPAVGGLHRLAMGRERGGGSEFAQGRDPGLAVEVFGHDEAGEGLQHRHGDVLALARGLLMPQRGQGGDDREQAAGLVGDPRRQGPKIGARRGERGQTVGAAAGLDQVVERLQAGVRTLGGVAHGLDIDDVRLDRCHRVIAEAQPPDGVGAHVVDEDVGGGDQLAQGAAAGLVLQIEGDRALVAVERDEGRTHRLRAGGLAVALAVPGRLLDLDHIGAEIAQGLGAVGAEDELGEIHHADAVERAFSSVHAVPRLEDCYRFDGTPSASSEGGLRAWDACS